MRAGGNQLATVSPTFSSFVGEFGGLFLSVKISVIVYIIVSAVKWFCIVWRLFALGILLFMWIYSLLLSVAVNCL